jgi:hypothetical membrane protein
MKRLLIKQALFLPLVYFGFIFLAGLFADNYSHLGQHASELGINTNKAASFLFKTGVILTSLSLFALSLGLRLMFGKRFTLFPILVFLFGVTFIFGALFPIGSPWHGLYGLGLFIMITPYVFLYELKDLSQNKTLHVLSIIAGLLMFLYLWSMVAGLDPMDFRGLTQRLFGVVVFGWFSLISFFLDSISERNLN